MTTTMGKAVFMMDEMPQNCVNCPIGAWMLHRLVCQATGRYGFKTERPQECPLNEIGDDNIAVMYVPQKGV